ncbi:MAG: protein of unknown function cysteine-rich region domain protein [Gemmatimonadetes bacterium]|nr:protein of unknown function cysteine-rich region domain protein [Gemmatimonadota bacterium]
MDGDKAPVAHRVRNAYLRPSSTPGRSMLRVLVLCTVSLASALPCARAQAPLRSAVFPPDSARSRKSTPANSQRSIVDSLTATLSKLEMHETTVPPGGSPHAPHRHTHEELMFIQKGTMEVLQGTTTRTAVTGSVVFMASNEWHGLRNSGTVPATYLVIRVDPHDIPQNEASIMTPPARPVKVALFAPCYVDQLYPQAAIAALRVLERLGVDVDVPMGATCCGQPPANAGFERKGEPALEGFVRAFAAYDHTVVLSGSCTLHVRLHAAHAGPNGTHVAGHTIEFCAFLHDVIGVDRVASLNVSSPRKVAVHIGCHGLRGLGLASPSELQIPRVDKVRALLNTVNGLTYASSARPDECCGFGGSFAVSELAVSTKMGRDRLVDFTNGGADAVVSTDMSCVMHLQGLARRNNIPLPMMHVAEVLAGNVA